MSNALKTKGFSECPDRCTAPAWAPQWPRLWPKGEPAARRRICRPGPGRHPAPFWRPVHEGARPRPRSPAGRHPRRRPRAACPRHHADRIQARRPSQDRAAAGAGAAAADRPRGARRHHRRAGRRQVDHHRCARHLSHGARPQGRGAGGRSLLGTHRRLDPRRQDPDGAARGRRQRLHPPLARRRHARRRRRQDARDHAALRGRGLRRRSWSRPSASASRRPPSPT